MGLLGVFVALAVAYGVVNPLFESPDELPHYRYVRDLVETRRLPVLELDGPQLESHQPPLYYTISALVAGWTSDEDLATWADRKTSIGRTMHPTADGTRHSISTAALSFPPTPGLRLESMSSDYSLWFSVYSRSG